MLKHLYAFWVTLTLLAVSAVALGSVAVQRGPLLREIQFHSESLTSQPAQQVALLFNQELAAEKPQLQITPNAQFTAETQGRKVILTFAHPLLAATAYTVTGTLQTAATGATSSITHSFHTAPLRMFALSHAPAENGVQPAKIIGYTVTKKPHAHEIISAPGITEFTQQGDWIALLRQATTHDAGYAALQPGEMRLTVQRLNGTQRADIAQPPAPTARTPLFSQDGSLLGIKFFNGHTDNLWLYTTSHLSDQAVRKITNPTGAELPVQDWAFVPGTSTVQLRTPAGEHYQMPFGKAAQLDPAPYPVRGHHNTQLPTQLTLTNKQRLQISADNKVLELVTGDTAQQIYTPAAASSQLTGLCQSPNGQYVAVKTVSDSAQHQFTVFDKNWENIFSIPGTTLNWCQ